MKNRFFKSCAAVLCAAMVVTGTVSYAGAEETDGSTGAGAEAFATAEEVDTGADGTEELNESGEKADAPKGYSSSALPAEEENGIQSQSAGAYASGDGYSGTCGANLTWSLDISTGLLTISGSGPMETFTSTAPWYDLRYEIRTVSLPEGLTTISEAAFYECIYLESAVMPSTMRSIGTGAFANCRNLSSLQLNEGLESVETYAFQDTAITAIKVPASLKTLDSLAFFRCGLEEIEVDSANPVYASRDGVLFSRDMKKLLTYPINRKADTYRIPSGVVTVGEDAFNGAAVGEIVIPSSVTSLENGAFAESEIRSLVIPDSVTSVGDYVCEGCAYLESVTTGSGLTEIGYRMFARCSSLTDVDLNECITSIEGLAFGWCYSLKEIRVPSKVTVINPGTFGACTSLTAVHLPDGLQVLGKQAFMYDEKLTEIDLPEGLQYIYEEAFVDSGITEIKIPDSVIYIENGAFPSETVVNTGLILTETGEYVRGIKVPVMSEKLYSEAFKVLELVNQERAAQGLGALTMDRELLDFAFVRADEIAFVFDHIRPTGQELTIPEGGRTFGENIAMGQRNAAEVMDSWMNSSGHRANILNASYTRIGIGAVVIEGGYYWVQCFSDGTIDEVSASSYKDGKTESQVLILYDAETADPRFTIGSRYLTPGGTTTIRLQAMGYDISPDQISFTSSDPSVCSVSADGTVKAVKNGTATVTATLKVSPDVTLSAEITVADYIRGDADSSGKVDISDLRLVLRHVCGKITLNETQTKAADVETDGRVDIKDLRKILRFVCQKIDSLD